MDSPNLDSALQRHIDEISKMRLDASIRAMIDLASDLTISISLQGKRLVSHPKYEGLGDLDTLGHLYLSSASRCTTEHASFDTRLLHLSLDPVIYDLYCSSEYALRDGIKAGAVTLSPNNESGCACCRGDPDAVILARFNEADALFFEEDEYKRLWGNQDSVGTQIGQDHRWLMASREQVEAARLRRAECQTQSML